MQCCIMYSAKKIVLINAAHTQTFIDKYKQKKSRSTTIICEKTSWKCIATVLKSYKIKRTQFITRQWLSSTSSFSLVMSPVNYGWKIADTGYQLKWFEGETSPRTLDVVCNDVIADFEEEGIYSFCVFLLNLLLW